MRAGAARRMTCPTPHRTRAIAPTDPPGDERMQTYCRPYWASPGRPDSPVSKCGSPLETRRSEGRPGSDQRLTQVMHDNETAQRDAVNAQVNGLATRKSCPAGVRHHKAGAQDVKAAGQRHVGRTGAPQCVLCMQRTEIRRSAAQACLAGRGECVQLGDPA